MERKGIITFDFDHRTITIEYTFFFFSGTYFIDLLDKHEVRHRFKRVDDGWHYCSLQSLKWRYDFTKRLFTEMDSILRKLAL